MKHKIITITVALDGGTRVETRGFAGPACRAASRFVEQALGRRLAERRTREFYQSTEASEVQREGTNPHADGP